APITVKAAERRSRNAAGQLEDASIRCDQRSAAIAERAVEGDRAGGTGGGIGLDRPLVNNARPTCASDHAALTADRNAGCDRQCRRPLWEDAGTETIAATLQDEGAGAAKCLAAGKQHRYSRRAIA